MRFAGDIHARIRARLMKKGLEVATVLADVLAGNERPADVRKLLGGDPGERPEEKLRRYLELIESRRALLDADDDRFGRCDICGADLGAMALQEMPWADRCPRHP